VLPVPERNLHVLDGGERISVGGRDFDVEYTPGHASHHVVYFDRAGATAYVGDVAGVRIPPADYVRAPTPPPDIDVEAWHRTIDEIERRAPERLALIHFGVATDVGRHLADLRARLDEWAEIARRVSDADAFASEIEAGLDVDEETRRAIDSAIPFWQSYLGLARYWSTRAA